MPDIRFPNMYRVDLEKGPAIKQLHQMFMGDKAANRIGAYLFQGDAAVSPGGSCSGTAILNDGSTVALTGTVSGNEIYIDLPPGCYAIPGPIQVYVLWTNGTVMTTVVAGFGTVTRTETGTIIDPGTIIPSVSQLISDIEDAVASIPADYSALLGSVAHTFSASTTYTAGKYVWYNGELYRFNVNHPAGAWIGTDAARYTATDEFPMIQQALGTKAGAADVADLKSAVPLLTDYSLGGEHTITANELETGTWIYTGKSDNSKRLRNKTLFPIKKGMTVQYANPTLKINLIVVQSMPTAAWTQATGWINAGSSGTFTAAYDGYLITLMESANDVTPSDYDCAITINSLLGVMDSIVNGITASNKNLWTGDASISFTASKTVTLVPPIPAGTYTLSALITSTDTDDTKCRFAINGTSPTKDLNRGTRDSGTFTTDAPITSIIFYAAMNSTKSSGDTATWADIQIEAGSAATAYVPRQLTAKDNVARAGLATLNDIMEEISNKNLWEGDATLTFTKTKTVELSTPLPAGTYTLSALITNTSGRTNDQVRVVPQNSGGTIFFSVYANTGARSSDTITVSTPITSLEFRSVTTAANSNGISATYTNIQIEAGSSATDYVAHETNPSAIDLVARDMLSGSNILQSYVSPSGSDENDGTYYSPFATVNHALEVGGQRIGLFGGKYYQQIDLSKLSSSRDVEIFALEPTKETVLYAPNCVLATEETQVAGYTKVYSAPCGRTFAANNICIFQDGVGSAEIAAAERMPEQRGRQYRCPDTAIWRCTSDNLADALTEIENGTWHKWFLSNGTLYYSRPEAVSATNPICGSFGANLFSGIGRSRAVRLTGLDIKYMVCNVNGTAGSVLKDCSCRNVYGAGCFVVDGACEALFIRCEASRAFTGTNGDGFNGHATMTNDPFAHQTTATLIDCWSHDNLDDGISLHERGEFTVIGGLFEYNGYGGGVTPANGCHCTCIGVYARKNGEGGFLYMNATETAEGGVGGQIKCIDCVSEANNTGAFPVMAGFNIKAAGNKGILINCKAISEDIGYFVGDNDGLLVLTDCGALNCTAVKGGETANITVQNTTLVN
jgi:hypothetical protein